jgi:hypothetical protein
MAVRRMLDPAHLNSVPPPLVRRRQVFNFIGYQPLTPVRIHGRFEKELDRFCRTWNVSATQSAPQAADPGATSWRIESRGPNWQVETQVTHLDWPEAVFADFAQRPWRAIYRGLAAIFEFLFSGAAAGYFHTNWRYLLFLIYPLFLLGVLAATSVAAACIAVNYGLPSPSASGSLLGIVCFVCLIHWTSGKTYLDYALRNWSFALDVINRRRPEFEAKLDQLAGAFARGVRDCTADEIVVFGHSLGVVIMMEVVARALQQDDTLARRNLTINLVSAGSSLLKIGLHPAAQHLRAAVSKVASEPAIYWVEYQSLVDIFNFYKTDPVAAMGLPACGKPIVRIVRIRHMVTEESYRRMRWNPFRLHMQYAMGNERRYHYDFFMICCGPVPLRRRVEQMDEVVAEFASNGTYLPLVPDNASSK